MVTARRLRAAPVAIRAGYHAIGARVIRRVAVTAVTTATRVGLAWLGVHVVFLGRMFGSVEYHATSKCAELICELVLSIPTHPNCHGLFLDPCRAWYVST